MLRVDRTDPSKNIVRGFEAFELYLERHPEAHGRVGMLALLDPSRQDIPQYAAYLRRDRRRGARGQRPVRAATAGSRSSSRSQDDFPRSVAAYKQYDVLLVNAVFDGLNLVAKEAPLVNERDGVLVLSENAGAYEELGAVGGRRSTRSTSPARRRRSTRRSSCRTSERRARAEAIRAHVREHDLGGVARRSSSPTSTGSALRSAGSRSATGKSS